MEGNAFIIPRHRPPLTLTRSFRSSSAVFVRGNDLFGSQFQGKLSYKTQLPSAIAETAYSLFEKQHSWRGAVRAVTVRAINLVPHADSEQLSLFNDNEKVVSPGNHLSDTTLTV